MKKKAIFTPRKTKAAALKQLRFAIKELGMENAIAIGLEIIKYPDAYRVVKNIPDSGETTFPNQIFYTEDASERIHAIDLAMDFAVQRTEELRKTQEALRAGA
jgi:hypothetical protein